MKYKITNKTGMRLRYNGEEFEPNESKVLKLDVAHSHEYFLIEKIENHNQKSKKSKKRIKLHTEVK